MILLHKSSKYIYTDSKMIFAQYFLLLSFMCIKQLIRSREKIINMRDIKRFIIS